MDVEGSPSGWVASAVVPTTHARQDDVWLDRTAVELGVVADVALHGLGRGDSGWGDHDPLPGKHRAEGAEEEPAGSTLKGWILWQVTTMATGRA
jgi:hypothetical protein